MIPAAFEYVRAESVDHAVALLGEHGDEAKLLAGGHSLLPLMKLRLATPAVLVDVDRVSELRYVRDEGDEVAVGALTRHRTLETSDVLAQHAPLLAEAARHVGDPQVRHRGTFGGALVHGDPASDLPAAALALGARFVIEGPAGRREVAVDEFFTGFLETAVAADEVLVEVRIPKATGVGWSFQKFNRRAQDWAIVGVALLHGPGSTDGPNGGGQPDTGRTGVGLVNMDARPVRAAAVEETLRSGASAADAASLAAEGCDPPEDLNASAEFRGHLARTLVARALAEAATR